VPTENKTSLMTYNGWRLRVHQASSQPARLLLMLHGWTGDEDSMWVFVRNFPSYYWMLGPRAPHPAEEGGYSWCPSKLGIRGWPTLDDLRPSAQALIRLIDELSVSIGVEAKQFDLLGFSQGAAMVSTIALLFPQRLGRAGVLAGFVPEGVSGVVATRPLAGKSIFVAYGTQDQLVLVDRARQSLATLEEAGAQVTFCSAEVGHKVSAECLRGLEAFFADPLKN
jgi:phospholipase/carboxylesterase